MPATREMQTLDDYYGLAKRDILDAVRTPRRSIAS